MAARGRRVNNAGPRTLTLKLLPTPPSTTCSESPNLRLGVVARNVKQKELIEGIIDVRARTELGVEH